MITIHNWLRTVFGIVDIAATSSFRPAQWNPSDGSNFASKDAQPYAMDGLGNSGQRLAHSDARTWSAAGPGRGDHSERGGGNRGDRWIRRGIPGAKRRCGRIASTEGRAAHEWNRAVGGGGLARDASGNHPIRRQYPAAVSVACPFQRSLWQAHIPIRAVRPATDSSINDSSPKAWRSLLCN